MKTKTKARKHKKLTPKANIFDFMTKEGLACCPQLTVKSFVLKREVEREPWPNMEAYAQTYVSKSMCNCRVGAN